jgi:hypothetical protein
MKITPPGLSAAGLIYKSTLMALPAVRHSIIFLSGHKIYTHSLHGPCRVCVSVAGGKDNKDCFEYSNRHRAYTHAEQRSLSAATSNNHGKKTPTAENGKHK